MSDFFPKAEQGISVFRDASWNLLEMFMPCFGNTLLGTKILPNECAIDLGKVICGR